MNDYSSEVQKAIETAPKEMTIEFIDRLLEYQKSKGMQMGGKLQIPKSMIVSEEVLEYASKKGIEITTAQWGIIQQDSPYKLTPRYL